MCPSLTTATADPGPGVVVALTDMRDRFRLTANTVELVPPDGPLPRLPVGRAVWQPAPDFATSAACWLAAGAAHHTCLSTAARGAGLTALGCWHARLRHQRSAQRPGL